MAGHNSEGLWLVCSNQGIEGCLQEAQAVNEPQLAKGKGHVLLHVVGNTLQIGLDFCNATHDVVGIVAFQVVED